MTKNKSFVRKVIYLCGIAVLFVPISLISAPATSPVEGGGKLTGLRREYRLSQAQLGKIDPASASMSLATLGMRGVAANLLWSSAIHYKKTENWDAFMAALNQITKLQPNFVSVWQFQSWNISYNVSVEFDDYRHRYHWVKKGVDYLTEGIEYNDEEPLLLSDAGWFFGHKIGRADEYRQFRRLFRDDEDFHDHLREANVPIEDLHGPDSKPDNWLVANYWFRRAQRAVDRGAQLSRLSTYYWMGDKPVVDKKQTPLRGKNPLVFHSEAPKALIRFADAIEEDGFLDEKGQFAWKTAENAWRQFGERDILSSWGITIHLNDLERAIREADEAQVKLLELAPGVEEKVREQKLAKLTETERKVLEMPAATRSDDQRQLAYELERKVQVTPVEVANAAAEDVRKEAVVQALRVEANRELARIVERYRGIVNYEYWLQRCIAEQEDNTIEARQLVLEAENRFDDGDLQGARELFEQAWDKWAVVFENFPIMIDDVEGEIVLESVVRYQKLLGQLDLTFPPQDFKLRMLLEAYKDDYDFSDVTASVTEPTPSSTIESSPEDENTSDPITEDESTPDESSPDESSPDERTTQENSQRDSATESDSADDQPAEEPDEGAAETPVAAAVEQFDGEPPAADATAAEQPPEP